MGSFGLIVTFLIILRIFNMIELSDLQEQVMPYQCPYCFNDMLDTDIIGETTYNVVRIGHNIGGTATVFECPLCFNKSFIHKESLKWKIR